MRRLFFLLFLFSFEGLASVAQAPSPCHLFNQDHSIFSENHVIGVAEKLEDLLEETLYQSTYGSEEDNRTLTHLEHILENDKARTQILEILDFNKIRVWRHVFSHQKTHRPSNQKARIDQLLKSLEQARNKSDSRSEDTKDSRTQALTPDEIRFINEHTIFHRDAKLEKLQHLPKKLLAKLPEIYLKLAKADNLGSIAEFYTGDHIDGHIWKYSVNAEGAAYRIAFARKNRINYIVAVISHAEYNSARKMILSRLKSFGF